MDGAGAKARGDVAKRATTRGRIGVAVLVTAAVLGLGAVTASPAAAAAEVVVSGPAAGEVVSSPAAVSGSAASASGVVAVGVAALRPSDNLWLQPTGGFAPGEAWWPATLGSPGQASTSWSATLPLPPGPVVVVARASAADGTSADAVTSFRVATRPMLTLQLGRAMLGQSSQCQPIPGQPTIFDVAGELRARGLFAVGVVVPDRTDDLAVQCEKGNLYPSWADYARLRDEFGWSFVSNGQRRLDLPQLSRKEQIVESCGSLDDFAARGHNRAWGLFGPNSNQITDAIAADVLNRCFAFTRLYSGGITEQQNLTAPYYERVRVAGGGRASGYDPPGEVLARIRALHDGDWLSLGSYKFVVGQRTGPDRQQWDCTSPDAARHWTTDDEVYCWTDYLAILDGLGAQQLEIVDPATVAERWGRVPSVEVARFTMPGSVAATAPTVDVSFSAYESGDYWVVANDTCTGTGPVVAGGGYRSATDLVVGVPVAALPVGTVELRLCLRNAFGRVGTAAGWLTVTA
jgi:hypothetical protein